MNKDIKYYLYLSRGKVDMLWEQLSRNDIEKISAELKINTGIFSAGLKSETKDKNLYSKLNIVLSFLEKRDVIGSLGTPRQFFKGTLPMSWREFDFNQEGSTGQIVLFSGFNEELNKVVGLIGSAAHFIGMHNLEPESFYYAQPSFWLKMADELNPPHETQITKQLYEVDNLIVSEARRRKDGPPKQNIEFVAKTFVDEKEFLLGSPIYVSEAGLL
jgi:hypothetical protein